MQNNPPKPEHILVKFKDEKNSENVKNEIKKKLSLKSLALKKKFIHSKIELLVPDMDDDFYAILEELRNHPEIHYAQIDRHFYPCGLSMNGRFQEQWGLKNTGQVDKFGNAGEIGVDVDIVNAWEITKGSASVVVAVVDTGIDIKHCVLKNNINYGVSTGWNFLNKDNEVFNPTSDSKHGTEVAGVIAASGSNSGVIGVAPDIRILPLKFMDARHGYTSDAIEAIEYAKAQGAKIVNCSWGDYNFNQALKFHIENSGMLFICAAGNDGNDLSEKPFYPACFDLPNLISVAAVNSRGKLWALSNYGKNVHLAAPGVNILCSIPTTDEDSFEYDTGTSLAAPHVTGVAALIMSICENIQVNEIKTILEQSVRVLPGLNSVVKTCGIVNAYKALDIARTQIKAGKN